MSRRVLIPLALLVPAAGDGVWFALRPSPPPHEAPGPIRFVDVTEEEIGLVANVAYAEGRPRGGMGIDAAEILPGTLAVAVVNFSNEPNTLLQLRRTNPPAFNDVAVATGVAGPSRPPMKFGSVFLDATSTAGRTSPPRTGTWNRTSRRRGPGRPTPRRRNSSPTPATGRGSGRRPRPKKSARTCSARSSAAGAPTWTTTATATSTS